MYLVFCFFAEPRMSLDRSVSSWKMLDLLRNYCEWGGGRQWPLGSFCNLCGIVMFSRQQGSPLGS